MDAREGEGRGEREKERETEERNREGREIAPYKASFQTTSALDAYSESEVLQSVHIACNCFALPMLAQRACCG